MRLSLFFFCHPLSYLYSLAWLNIFYLNVNNIPLNILYITLGINGNASRNVVL